MKHSFRTLLSCIGRWLAGRPRGGLFGVLVGVAPTANPESPVNGSG